MSSNRTKLTFAHLHTVTFVPGLGNLKAQFETKANTTNPSSSVLADSIDLIDNQMVEIKVKAKDNKFITFLTPATNFSVLIPAPM